MLCLLDVFYGRVRGAMWPERIGIRCSAEGSDRGTNSFVGKGTLLARAVLPRGTIAVSSNGSGSFLSLQADGGGEIRQKTESDTTKFQPGTVTTASKDIDETYFSRWRWNFVVS